MRKTNAAAIMNMLQPGIKTNSGIDPGLSVSRNSDKLSVFKQIFHELNHQQKQHQNQELEDEIENVVGLLTLTGTEQQQRLNEMSSELLQRLMEDMEMSFDRFIKKLRESNFIENDLSQDIKQILDKRWHNLKQLITVIIDNNKLSGVWSQQLLNDVEPGDFLDNMQSLIDVSEQKRVIKLKKMSLQALKVLRQQIQQNDSALSAGQRPQWLQLVKDIDKLIEQNRESVKILQQQAGVDVSRELKNIPVSQLNKLVEKIDGLHKQSRIVKLILANTNTNISKNQENTVINSEQILDILKTDSDHLTPEIKRVLVKILDSSTPVNLQYQQLSRLNSQQLKQLYNLVENNNLEEIVSLKELNHIEAGLLQGKYNKLQPVLSELVYEKAGTMDKDLLYQYLNQESAFNMKADAGEERINNKGKSDEINTSLKDLFTYNIRELTSGSADSSDFIRADIFSHQKQPYFMSGLLDSGQSIYNQQPQVNGVIEQIMDKIQLYQQPGINKLELQLEPETLGKVKLNLELKGGEIKAQFQVENLFIKHHLEQNIQGLRTNLVKQGFEVDRISIESSNPEGSTDYGSQSDDNQDQNQQQQQQEHDFSFDYYSREQVQQLIDTSPEELAQMRLKVIPWMLGNYLHMNFLA